MTISPFQFYNVNQLYNRISQLKSSENTEREQDVERQDVVSISSEARKKQLLEQTRREVLQKIKSGGPVKR